MSSRRYPEEFKIEAVKQITEKRYPVAEVAVRLGVSQHSLYKWVKCYGLPESGRIEAQSQQAELRRLKAERKRVIEERNILKRPQRTLPRNPGEVRLYQGTRTTVSRTQVVPCHGGQSGGHYAWRATPVSASQR
jgi:transposase-like protein